jgi:hypothetical protein
MRYVAQQGRKIPSISRTGLECIIRIGRFVLRSLVDTFSCLVNVGSVLSQTKHCHAATLCLMKMAKGRIYGKSAGCKQRLDFLHPGSNASCANTVVTAAVKPRKKICSPRMPILWAVAPCQRACMYICYVVALTTLAHATLGVTVVFSVVSSVSF